LRREFGDLMPSRRLKRSDRLVYRLVAGEHLLIDLHSKARVPYFLLTPTAAAVWESLDRWTTVDVIAADLTSRFDVPIDAAKQDVDEFLRQLDEMGGLQYEGVGE
jgi:hypothetical protein